MRYLQMIVLFGLAGCATPYEQCVNKATRDLQTVEKLIAKAETNLERGFRRVPHPSTRLSIGTCSDGNGGWIMCTQVVENIELRVEAIDPAVEKRKLRNLRAKQAELSQKAGAQEVACAAAYPS